MQVSIKLKETEQQIQALILKQLNKAIVECLSKAKIGIARAVKLQVEAAIKRAPEYESLTSDDGKLRVQFGLVDADSKVKEIIDLFVNEIQVVVRTPLVSGSTIRAGIEIKAIKGDFSDALSSTSASQITEKGESLPWLEWLLTRGDTIILREYEVVSKGKALAKSRTGGAVTIKKKSGSWRVPPEFSGSEGDNWITRAIDSIDATIESTIEAEIINAWQ